jgi:hypothetical protein
MVCQEVPFRSESLKRRLGRDPCLLTKQTPGEYTYFQIPSILIDGVLRL